MHLSSPPFLQSETQYCKVLGEQLFSRSTPVNHQCTLVKSGVLGVEIFSPVNHGEVRFFNEFC